MEKDVKIEDKAKLVQESEKIRSELRKLRFDLALSQLDDTSKIRQQKKEIARVSTKLTKIKELEIQAKQLEKGN